MRSRAMRTQARLTAVAELLEAPVFGDADGEAPSDCPSSSAFFPSGPEDGYCSLCRRCQMRRKLEKRLQKKRDEGDGSHEEREVEDERSIEELMEYIGEDNAKSRTRRRRRRRRKRSQNDNDVDAPNSHEANSPHSTNSGIGSASSVVEHEMFAFKSGFNDGDSRQGAPLLCRSDGGTDDDGCDGHHDCHGDCGISERDATFERTDMVDGITPEQEAEIQKEVEEFRMRLACQHPPRNLPRIAIPNF